MDFVTHFPWTSQRHDAVWVIVDQITKSAHFLVVRIGWPRAEPSRILLGLARAQKILIELEARLKLDSSFLFMFKFSSRKKK